jgi:hypothetical protein
MIDTPTSGANDSSLADEDFLAANKARKQQNIGDSTYSLNSKILFYFMNQSCIFLDCRNNTYLSYLI